MLAKAFGKFIAEIKHVCYEPRTPAFVLDSLNPEQDCLSSEFNHTPDYAKAFTKEYGIYIGHDSLLKVMEFLKYSDKTTVSPQLTENLDDLISSESCPLPKQTLAKLLGKSIDEIPPHYKIDCIPKSYGRSEEEYILRRKNLVEQPNIKQITENGEETQHDKSQNHASPSSTNNQVDDKTIEDASIGTGVVGVTSLAASAIAFAIENAEKVKIHKVSAVLASAGAVFVGISASISCFAKKFKSEKPSTKIKTHILDREYKLDPNTFLGVRVLIVDGKREEIESPFGESEALIRCKDAFKEFYHLKEAIDGTHERLPTMLSDPSDQALYITIAKSFIESHYEMMCEFPEIIAERREYEDYVRDRRDLNLHSREYVHGLWDRVDAEFVRY